MTKWDGILETMDEIIQDNLGKIEESGLPEWCESRGLKLTTEANALLQIVRLAQLRLDALNCNIGTTAILLKVMNSLMPLPDDAFGGE